MNPARRDFIRLSTSVIGVAISGLAAAGQSARSRTTLHPPDPAEGPEVMRLSPGSQLPPGPSLEQREKDFRQCLEQLCTFAGELREEVSRLQLSRVFPIQVFKETEALEQLARRLKKLAKS